MQVVKILIGVIIGTFIVYQLGEIIYWVHIIAIK
jgi:hypothetical protein